MSEFLALSACRGRRPEKVLGRRLVSRPDLISRLLRERHVARFIVAPDGFGKTSLAFEYADTVHAFQHVFWVNGKSPCFLRDLDAGVVDRRLQELDAGPFLAVFEDVPRLETDRAVRFSGVIDALLEAGHEVMVTCTPSCDAYAETHRDRMKLSAADLLLSDAEVQVAAMGFQAGDSPQTAFPRSERVAGLCWGGDDGSKLLAGLAREELPSDMLLAIFVMLVLHEGTWADLEAFAPSGKAARTVRALEDGYPMLGVDVRGERFSTLRVSVETAVGAFDRVLDDVARPSVFGRRGLLARRLADALLARSEGSRACAFMAAAASRSECAAWLAQSGSRLLKSVCVQPAHELFAYTGRSKGEWRAALNADEAWRLAALGDRPAAVALARRTAFSVRNPPASRAASLMVLWGLAEGETRQKAVEALSALTAQAAGEGALCCPPALPHAARMEEATAAWACLAGVLLALERGVACAVETWEAWRPFVRNADVLCVAASSVLRAAVKAGSLEGGAEADAAVADGFDSLARFVFDHMEKRLGESPDLLAALAGEALDDACEAGLLPAEFSLPHRALSAIRRLDAALRDQREAYGRSLERTRERRDDYNATHPDPFREVRGASSPVSSAVAPPLHVNLFGGLEVSMDGRAIDPSAFTRRKAKTLLALLVLNRGAEMSRDKLVRCLWPDSEIEAARKNLYAIWSLLRRILSLPDGSCPYLVRERDGCRLDARLVTSDIGQFETLCRTLLFGRPDMEEWEQVLAQINERFSDDLLPSERECDLIVRSRTEYRMRLVDALVAASARLVAAGEARGGLWYAREALRHDAAREDVYIALMEAQIAAGQRTAALESYFACRAFLADELGIDPSLKTMSLYREIIEAEDVVDW